MEIINKIKQLLANDSARVKDVNGYLSVADCNISKADVNPYYGRDIPNWQELGLVPDKIYMMLRDPSELEMAAPTFSGKPLLRGHHDIHAGDIPKEMIIGSIGTDSHYSNPFVVATLNVWDANDIELIEADKVKELSSSYFYRPDMTAGEFNGVQYDGVMRDIVGNHVAVVERGRAGSQVAVADSDFNINMKGLKNMKLSEFKKFFGGLLAKDAKDEEIEEALKKADDETDKKEDSKAEDEEEDKKADDEEDDKKSNDESEDDDKKANDSVFTAKDAALLEQSIEKRLAEKFKRANQAQSAVRPFIGELAMDSADDIYKAGLKHFGVDVSSLPSSAYQATFEAVSKANAVKKANDAAPKSTGFLDSLPNRKTL